MVNDIEVLERLSKIPVKKGVRLLISRSLSNLEEALWKRKSYDWDRIVETYGKKRTARRVSMLETLSSKNFRLLMKILDEDEGEP